MESCHENNDVFELVIGEGVDIELSDAEVTSWARTCDEA